MHSLGLVAPLPLSALSFLSHVFGGVDWLCPSDSMTYLAVCFVSLFPVHPADALS